MSSYLNIYLVPKTKEETTEKPEPLHFTSYSRNSDVYQAFDENVHPAYAGNEKKYTELTSSLMNTVEEEAEKEVREAKFNFENRIKAYKELSQLTDEQLDDYIGEYISAKEYIKELEDTLHEIQYISFIVSGIEFSDFEKVLINID